MCILIPDISRLFESSVEKQEILNMDPVEFLGLQVKTFLFSSPNPMLLNLGSKNSKRF